MYRPLMNSVDYNVINADDLGLKTRPGGASVWHSAFNICCTVVGVGLLDLPYALAQSGWIGIALMVVMAMFATYTAIILIRPFRRPEELTSEKLETYGDLGHLALGPFGRYTVEVFQHVTLVGAATVFLVLSSSFLLSLVPQLESTKWATLVLVGVVYGHVFLKTLKEIGILSAFNLSVAVFLVVVVVIEAIRNRDASAEHDIIRLGPTLAVSFANISFAFSVHPLLPDIFQNMAQPSRYTQMVSGSFIVVCLLYLPMAIMGYYSFGRDIEGEILSVLPSSTLVTIVTWAITVHVCMSFCIVVNPSERALERLCGIDRSPYELFLRILIRTCLLGFIGGLAVLVPDFPDMLTLVSSITSTGTVFVLPTIFNIKLYRRTMGIPALVLNITILIVAVVGGIIGGIQGLEGMANTVFHKDWDILPA